ncbi:hypothetical protein Pmani_013785 [Petrolisthes manimaculis]|uniref:Uncharacterized protein n=1 Tax=Petrolisthes manimaculis TaxID=1843537 RepID=A0AAE1UDS5_9EUCA|nr:hypothetical protein Pmani_013785 [Petrolisthes manimaculis]
MRRKSGDQISPRDSEDMGMSSPTNTTLDSEDDPKVSQSESPPTPLMWERWVECGMSYLHISPGIKIFYYTITLIIFTVVQESEAVPHFQTLTGKYSILNQVFVKQGWGFTLGAYVLYQLLSCVLHGKSCWSNSLRRLAVGTVVTTFFFFIWCQVIFPGVEYLTSACTFNNILVNLGKRECFKHKGHTYHSFDISGHSYLLIYCVLVLMEESKSVLYYLQLGQYLRGAPPEAGKSTGNNNSDFRKPSWTQPKWMEPSSEGDAELLRWLHPLVSPFLTAAFLFMVFLALLWDFMLIITTIYYHTFPEKVLGTGLAVGMWYLVYGIIFPRMINWRFFTPHKTTQ